MGKKKILVFLFIPLLLVSFLQSQSLAELAKKEKERRAALKGKAAAVITSAELANVKKKPAVESARQEQTAEEAAAQAGQTDVKAGQDVTPPAAGQPAAAQAGQTDVKAGQDVTPPAAGQPAAAGSEEAKATAAAAEKPPEETPPGETPAMSEKEFQAKQAELVKAAKEKQDMIDLLTLKLNSLYQEFYGLDNIKSRELIQLQISDTYDKLLKAETDAKKATKDLEDFFAKTKRENVPDIWIK
jgi:hypothetical protein